MNVHSIDEFEHVYFPLDYAKKQREKRIEEVGIGAVMAEEALEKVFETQGAIAMPVRTRENSLHQREIEDAYQRGFDDAKKMAAQSVTPELFRAAMDEGDVGYCEGDCNIDTMVEYIQKVILALQPKP